MHSLRQLCLNAQMSAQTLFLHLHPVLLVIDTTKALKHVERQQADVCTASRSYLAHHELESEFVVVMTVLLQIWQMSEHIYEDDFKADAMQP